MKAILIAAGRGRRLGPHTSDIPKCMVPVAGKSMLARFWQACESAGATELVVIRGYKADVLTAEVGRLGVPTRFVDNLYWETNNVLQSLACARYEMEGPALISYSDIVFTPEVAKAAVESKADIGLIIDRAFRDVYVGRTDHPLDEAEVADLRPDGAVARVGKKAFAAEHAIGEFIGLLRTSADGMQQLTNVLDRAMASYYKRYEDPYQRAKTFQNAYLTDLLQDAIDRGVRIEPIFIDGSWREIDTEQDLARATEMMHAAPKDWL